MLAAVRPDVVHVTAPAPTHFPLTRDALEAGAHVLVEKPAAGSHEEVLQLLDLAQQTNRVVVENHNYVWDPAIVRMRELVADGRLGEVRHVEVSVALELFGDSSRYRDPDSPHPALARPGEAVTEFITHLASLAHAFVGPHRSVEAIWQRTGPEGQVGELQALVEAERGTALLSFSATAQPNDFTVRVRGTRMRASARLFDRRLLVTGPRGFPRPISALLDDLEESVITGRAGVAALREKLAGGPGTYAGLWELIRRTYVGLAGQGPLPITHQDVDEVNAAADAILATAPAPLP